MMDHRSARFAGIDHGNWCVIANLVYLVVLIAAACGLLNLVWSLSGWQNLIAAGVLFIPLGWFVDHHAHGTLLVDAWFRRRRASG